MLHSFMEHASERVLRVNQLDATELDQQLTEILQHQFVEIFHNLPSLYLSRFKPELKALVRFVLWSWSVRQRGSTFGQDMLGLQYSLSASQFKPLKLSHRLFIFVLLVLSEWIKDRVDTVARILRLPLTPAALERTLNRVLAVVKMLSLLNFVVFLIRGVHPTLKENALGLHMLSKHPQALRSTSYEYMNREILWHGFSEFIFFVLPHLNLFAAQNWIRRMVGIIRKPSSGEEDATRDFTCCVFCEKQPTMPHVSACGHVYCYYCLRANLVADGSFPCSACGADTTSCTYCLAE